MPHLASNRQRPAVTVPAAAGVAYAAAWIAALAIWPSNPSVDASKAHVMAAFTGHEGVAIAQYALAQGVAAAALATVVIALDRAARRAGGRAARLGRATAAAGLAAVSVSAIQLVLGVVLSASAVPAGGEDRALGLFEAINRLDGVKMLALATMAAAATAAARQGLLPRRLGGVSAVLAAALVASGAGYLLLDPTPAQAAYVSLPLLLVWVTGTGIVLGRSEPAARRLPLVTAENRKWWTLGAVSFGLFMIMLDNTVVNVALPDDPA